MSWIKWGILFSVVLLRVSAEQQPSRSGSRRLYVQPAAAAADGPVSGQHGAYSLELHAKLAGQVGTRRLGNPAAPELSQRRSRHAQSPMPSGVNVCGGQCCHGWSETQGSQRCTKPNCIPQCQNGGLCLRPQLCICKPGSTGKACEEKTVDTYPFPALPENGLNNGQTNGHNIVPQRPIPQQVPPDGYAPSPLSNNMAPVKLAVKSAPHHVQPQYIQQHIQQRIQSIHPGQMKQHVRKQLKYYHSHSTHAEMQGHSQNNRPAPMRVGHSSIHAVGNHTGRIKVVFTPTICKLTCIGGRCQNNCKLGNTTTIISENGHATDTLTAPNFRVVVCHLPCINGGKCSARDKCQCPPSFTGKFCQMPVQDGHQQTSDGNSQTQVYSTHTLPLSYDNGQGTVFNPSIVNVHIKHPPEASVQIHQVSQLDNYHNGRHHLKGFQSSFSSSSVVFPGQHGYQVSQYQQFTHKNTLGRCFQETKGNQCGKALSGLIKQEQCCGTFGTSWGFHKCLKCPNKPFTDLDECQIHGVCPNGTCLNTIGSYRCKCNPGFVPDPTLTTCISSTPVAQLEKGSCFRLISSGRQCLHPVMAQLSKELCCCSVGKAWGPHCVKCPPPGTAKFRELCPGGLGYTVLPNPPVSKPVTISQKLTDLQTPLTLPTTERPVEPFGQTEEIIPEIVEKTSSPLPVEILPTNANQDIGPTQSAEVNECQISPYICGHGICYNTAESYTCHCDEGYHLDDGQSTCVDINECANDAHLCSPHGKCLNTEGSYQCVCDSGFTARMDTPSCEDIDECGLNDTLCGPHGFCENRVGSFRCLCDQGYKESQNGQMCVASPVERKDCYYDLNNENLCESVLTSHVTLQECCCTLGAGWGDNCEVHPCPVSGTDQFDQMCQSGKGYILPEDLLPDDVPSAENYRDADECVLFREEVCKGGFCLNTVGSYDCYCKTGQDYDLLKLECRDINECLDDTSCVGGQCVNTDGSYICSCTHPMVLDPTTNHCVLIPEVAEKHEADDTDYLDICWQSVTETLTCTLPLASQTKTTYTECCCLYGQAWGMDCALCPSRNTEDFALMCSQDLGDGKQLYGHDALVATPDKVDPETTEQRSVLPFYDNEEYLHTAFEGLQATECGTPNGCRNGRCVRVQEGYTCDCFDGYTLDPSHMACVDVNECSELNGQTLCKNARCINTIGSYRCVCLPGFTASKKPNYCVAAATQQT